MDSRIKMFTKSSFDKHPVWVWDDDMDAEIPLSDMEPSKNEFGAFFIKCQFEVSKHSFEGYLIGNNSCYAIGLFLENEEFILNKNTPDLNEKTLKKICKILQCDPFPLYPIFYKSDVRFKEGGEISGVPDFRGK